MPPKISFEYFLEQFPVAELPITIGEETVREISKATKPLNQQLIEQYLMEYEDAAANEDFTEFVPCFQLPAQEQFIGIVYWRADLLQYHYVLVTLDARSGEMVDRKVIGGTSYNGKDLIQSSGMITEDLMVFVVSGQGLAQDYDYEAAGSTANRFQVAEDGKILEF